MTASYDFDRDQPADARGALKATFDHLDASVAVLAETASTLADKLEFVLRLAVPHAVPGDEDKAAKRDSFDESPAQSRLRRADDQIQGVTAKLRDLVERLET